MCLTKEIFIEKLNKELENISLNDLKKFIAEYLSVAPSIDYEFVLCKIKHFKNEKNNIDNATLNKYNNIISKFEEIDDGNICFNSYSYEMGTYSYYDADVDYVYYPSSELETILKDSYLLMKKLTWYEEYSKVISLFELIINSDYTCNEVGNPEYDNTNEIYDSYEVSFDLIKNHLSIDLNNACLYAIYSLIMCNKSDKFKKIYEYIKICGNVNINDIKNIGIKKIDNFDKFYREWSNYLALKEKI